MWMAAEQELAALGYLIAPEPSLGSTVRRMLGRSTPSQPNGVTHGTTRSAADWSSRLAQGELGHDRAVITPHHCMVADSPDRQLGRN